MLTDEQGWAWLHDLVNNPRTNLPEAIDNIREAMSDAIDTLRKVRDPE